MVAFKGHSDGLQGRGGIQIASGIKFDLRSELSDLWIITVTTIDIGTSTKNATDSFSL